MSTDPTGTDVFEEIDPDPDVVLADCGVDSPEDLVDAGGAHDPVPDAAVDADDTTAAELFADLAGVVDGDSVGGAADTETTRGDGIDRTDEDPDHDLGAFEFVGDSDVVVRDDGDVIESSAADLSALESSLPSGSSTTDSSPTTDPSPALDEGVESPAGGSDRDGGDDSRGGLTVRAGFADEAELVGPGPSATRVGNDAFGRTDAEGE